LGFWVDLFVFVWSWLLLVCFWFIGDDFAFSLVVGIKMVESLWLLPGHLLGQFLISLSSRKFERLLLSCLALLFELDLLKAVSNFFSHGLFSTHENLRLLYLSKFCLELIAGFQDERQQIGRASRRSLLR